MQGIDIDATPDPSSLSLSFARGRAKVQAWGRVDGHYPRVLIVNYSVNKEGISQILDIMHLLLINSTSYGGCDYLAGECSIIQEMGIK